VILTDTIGVAFLFLADFYVISTFASLAFMEKVEMLDKDKRIGKIQ
jgi:hypothetical protein